MGKGKILVLIFWGLCWGFQANAEDPSLSREHENELSGPDWVETDQSSALSKLITQLRKSIGGGNQGRVMEGAEGAIYTSVAASRQIEGEWTIDFLHEPVREVRDLNPRYRCEDVKLVEMFLGAPHNQETENFWDDETIPRAVKIENLQQYFPEYHIGKSQAGPHSFKLLQGSPRELAGAGVCSDVRNQLTPIDETHLDVTAIYTFRGGEGCDIKNGSRESQLYLRNCELAFHFHALRGRQAERLAEAALIEKEEQF